MFFSVMFRYDCVTIRYDSEIFSALADLAYSRLVDADGPGFRSAIGAYFLEEAVSETASYSDRMQKLQQMRVALVLLLSEEHTKLQRQHRHVSGMEIEIMGAERDHAADTLPTAKLDQLYDQDRVTRETLKEIETEITRMEQVLAKIDVDIGEMCQS